MNFIRRAWNRLRGYKAGGYTGPPEGYEPAGIVYAGSFIQNFRGDFYYGEKDMYDNTWIVLRNDKYKGTYNQYEIDEFKYLDEWTN